MVGPAPAIPKQGVCIIQLLDNGRSRNRGFTRSGGGVTDRGQLGEQGTVGSGGRLEQSSCLELILSLESGEVEGDVLKRLVPCLGFLLEASRDGDAS
jgi:hypothetical protein